MSVLALFLVYLLTFLGLATLVVPPLQTLLLDGIGLEGCLIVGDVVRLVVSPGDRCCAQIGEQVKEQVEGALEQATAAINDRLGAAELATDQAIKGLERSFAELDERVKRTEEQIGEGEDAAARDAGRSEEQRVGEECRSRWSPDD